MTPQPMLRVEARFKNARLYNAIKEHSLRVGVNQRALGPVNAWCRLNDLSPQHVYKLLNLRVLPYRTRLGVDGNVLWLPHSVRMAALLECDVDWLFPRELYGMQWPRLAVETNEVPMISLASLTGSDRLALPPAVDEPIVRRECATAISAVLETLTPREERVIRARFGLDDDSEQTMAEVAAGLGVSKERIRQIEMKALRKMRDPQRSKFLVPHLQALNT